VQSLLECAPMSPDVRDAWLDEIIAVLRPIASARLIGGYVKPSG
jgi:hypothetical protein